MWAISSLMPLIYDRAIELFHFGPIQNCEMHLSLSYHRKVIGLSSKAPLQDPPILLNAMLEILYLSYHLI